MDLNVFLDYVYEGREFEFSLDLSHIFYITT